MGNASHISIVVHTHPDGNAVGSGTAMLCYLTQSRGKDGAESITGQHSELDLVHNARRRRRLHPGFRRGKGESLRPGSTPATLSSVWTATPSPDIRDGRRAEGGQNLKVLIDHHLNPDIEAFGLVFSETGGYSRRANCCSGDLLDMPAMGGKASSLRRQAPRRYLAMTTDTNNFANSVFPGTPGDGLRTHRSRVWHGTDPV